MNKYCAPRIVNGSFGNNLFILGACLQLVQEHDFKLVLPDEFRDTLPVFKYDFSSHINDKFYNGFRRKYEFTHDKFEYVRIPIHDSIFLGINKSYYQSYKYLQTIKTQLIEQYFAPSAPIEEILDRYNFVDSIGVHVRRGDYLKQPNRGIVKGPDYYRRAMDLFPDENFLIFSNDLSWCKQNLNFPNKKIDFLTFSPRPHDGNRVNKWDWRNAIDMFCMSRCKHNIIANSSYSYFSAFLNKNKNRKVIYPSEWFGWDNHNMDDVIPPNDGWMEI